MKKTREMAVIDMIIQECANEHEEKMEKVFIRVKEKLLQELS